VVRAVERVGAPGLKSGVRVSSLGSGFRM
jgi:hypothetical protein